MEPSPASARSARASSSAAIFSRAGEISELAENLLKAHGAKAEVLAARTDGLRNILGSGRGQHENHMAGRLFQSLEQRIEGRVGDLVGFVEDIYLEAVACRAVAGGFAEFADFVDAAVSGGVDFDDIDRVPGANFGAGLAYAARFRHRLIRRAAIQRHGQNARHRGLADPAMAAEDVAVRGAALLDGVFQSAGDVLLPDDLGKFLRAIFARQDLIAHERRITDYT